ncbi:hypothetical protein [Desulfolutivibrio sulfodismutans]|nr:hypothetical protein [Desulfolutivibrio sulfodismutans]QLA13567.1 hypothetical protein GD606_15480 [Desulfolutivibrio sulfodismutans DSM 3696]
MEWRTIPNYPAYEISESGTVRKTGTGYQLGKSGRRYGLWDGKQRRYFYPFELVEQAFGPREGGSESKPIKAPRPELPPLAIPAPAESDDNRCAALEREKEELECEIEDKQCEIDRLREILDALDSRAKRVHRTTDATMTEENAILKGENRQLKRLVAELEAELQVYMVAI